MRFRLRTLLIVMSGLCAYLALYVARLEPKLIVSERHLGMVISGHREPSYCVGGNIARVTFFPVATLDRRLRPNFWRQAADVPAIHLPSPNNLGE